MHESINSPRKRVFLSYVSKDRSVAKRIACELEKRGFIPWLSEIEILPMDSIDSKIKKGISSSDYIFILFSKHYSKQWKEPAFAGLYFEEQIKRNITIIPILLDDSKIPSYLLQFQFFDLRGQTSSQIRKLVEQIEVAPRIDFTLIAGIEFEQLIMDLLEKLKFKIIKHRGHVDLGFDFEAEYHRKDPFGVMIIERWIIETKIYHNDRFSINSLRQLLGSLSVLGYDANALLVTTSQLTSTAKNWLNHSSKNEEKIRVIEGPELRRLLLKFPDLVDKYFPKLRA